MSPEKPDALLWMDVETTGLDTNKCSILEIGLRCTSMDAMREHARLEAVVHISRETMLSAQLPALDLHLNNGLLAQCETSDPAHCSPEAIALETVRFIKDMSGMYTLHPAGTNIQRFDLPMILRFCEPVERVNDLLSYRALDVTTLRLAAKALGRDPYTHRAKPTHRVHDCLDRDIAEYQFTGDNVNLGEWSSSNLNVFIPVIEKAVEHIAAETRTPGHYLLTNAEVPATGYEVAEAGLVSKTIERISFLKSPIRDICSIAMRYENDANEADIIADSKVQFATPQYRSETLMADAMLKYKQLGFPIQWVAEQMGQSSDEVQRIMRMRADEMADPELESLNRALQIGGADGGRIAGAGLQSETAGDVGAGGGQGRAQNMEQGRRQ